MKLRAEIVKAEIIEFGFKVFHVRLAKGVRRFSRESIVRRHIGPRPWCEMFFVDEQGRVHEVFSK